MTASERILLNEKLMYEFLFVIAALVNYDLLIAVRGLGQTKELIP
jgi:hypothetical protein